MEVRFLKRYILWLQWERHVSLKIQSTRILTPEFQFLRTALASEVFSPLRTAVILWNVNQTAYWQLPTILKAEFLPLEPFSQFLLSTINEMCSGAVSFMSQSSSQSILLINKSSLQHFKDFQWLSSVSWVLFLNALLFVLSPNSYTSKLALLFSVTFQQYNACF